MRRLRQGATSGGLGTMGFRLPTAIGVTETDRGLLFEKLEDVLGVRHEAFERVGEFFR